MMDLLGGNDDVADRIRTERERRGWTYRELAEQMAREGCVIAASTLQRIEKGSGPGRPRPKIGVEELVAACRVFEISPDELLTPIELVNQARAQRLIDDISSAVQGIWTSAERAYGLMVEANGLGDAEASAYIANQVGHAGMLPPAQSSVWVRRAILPALRDLVHAALWAGVPGFLELPERDRYKLMVAKGEADLRDAEASGDADRVAEATYVLNTARDLLSGMEGWTRR